MEEDQSDQRIWSAIDAIYNDFIESNRKGREEKFISVDLPMKEDVMDEIRNIFNPKKNNYHVQIVNSDEQVESLLDEETGELQLDTAANIFIGGNILDRGITIKICYASSMVAIRKTSSKIRYFSMLECMEHVPRKIWL